MLFLLGDFLYFSPIVPQAFFFFSSLDTVRRSVSIFLSGQMEQNLQQPSTQQPTQPAASLTARPPLLATPAPGPVTTLSHPVLTLPRSFNGPFISSPRLGFGHQLVRPASPSKRLSLSSRPTSTVSHANVQSSVQSSNSLASTSLDISVAPANAPPPSAPLFAPFSPFSPSIENFIESTSLVQPQDATTGNILVLEDEPEPPLPNPAEGDISPQGLMIYHCNILNSYTAACYTAFKKRFAGQFNGKRAKLTPRGEGDDEDWEWRKISKPFVQDQGLYVHVMWRHVSLLLIYHSFHLMFADQNGK